MTGGYRSDVLATAQAILSGPLAQAALVRSVTSSETVAEIAVAHAKAVVDLVRALPDPATQPKAGA